MTDKALTTIGEGRDLVQAPAKFEPPALQTFEKYSADLVPFDYDDIDEHGKKVSKTWPLPEINKHTELIHEPDCHAIVAEIEAALVPANYKTARAFTDTLIGRGIGTKFNNVAIFVTEATNLFTKYPAYIGFRAVELLDSFEYGVPHVGVISQMLEQLVKNWRGALRQVRAHLTEHERRRGKPAPKEKLFKQIERFKGLAPAIKAAVGEAAFRIFWPTLWLFSDDGAHMILAQPSRWLRDITHPHLVAIGKVADRICELIIRQKPASGSLTSEDGPRPIGDVLKGD